MFVGVNMATMPQRDFYAQLYTEIYVTPTTRGCWGTERFYARSVLPRRRRSPCDHFDCLIDDEKSPLLRRR